MFIVCVLVFSCRKSHTLALDFKLAASPLNSFLQDLQLKKGSLACNNPENRTFGHWPGQALQRLKFHRIERIFGEYRYSRKHTIAKNGNYNFTCSITNLHVSLSFLIGIICTDNMLRNIFDMRNSGHLKLVCVG
jgi:hypothetical protein